MSLLSSSLAHADVRDWRITVTCDADAREARVEMFNCDANATGETSCARQKNITSEDGRVITLDALATRRLHTALRRGPEAVGLVTNHPTEFSCECHMEKHIEIRMKRRAISQFFFVLSATQQLLIGMDSAELRLIKQCYQYSLESLIST